MSNNILICLGIFLFRFTSVQYNVPTCNHYGEFESLLDTLAKNLIGKIRKPHIALHSFSTLLKKNKQPKLV